MITRITNREFIVSRSEFQSIEELPSILERKADGDILRWYISKAGAKEIVVDATLFKKAGIDLPEGVHDIVYPGKSVVLSLIPTGVGCDIGGYAADAAPVTALLSSCVDYLITNPNAVNASNFINMADNVLYSEGFTIDLFCKGLVNLYKPYGNKVGLIVEKTDRESLETVFNIINTARAVHGVDIEHVVVTEEAIGGRCVQYKSGAYVGTLDDPSVLFDATDRLIAKGVTAVAVTSNIRDLPADNYARHFDGLHPNPVGGAEAVLSHLISEKYRIPAAHAPLMNIKELDLKSNIVDARGAGEFSSRSGLACILIGLGKAPQIKKDNNCRIKDIVNIDNVLAMVTPAGTLGGIPMLYAQKYNIPIIAVKENKTVLDVTGEKLGLKNVIEADNYLEAVGVLQALRSGISIESLRRPLKTLRF